MATKVFLTGITGYIGGDIFYNLSAASDRYHISALVREPKAGLIRDKCPKVTVVVGELDDYDLIRREAAKADIVVHTADASDHKGASQAIAAGLLQGHSKEKPGYWIHTGGTGILTYKDAESGKLGEWPEEEYNDWSGVDTLTSLPDSAFHRDVDKIVLAAGIDHADVIKTAIVCPPTIYGKGRGPSLVRGRQVYELAKLILNEQCQPVIGAGRARWNYIHIHDLSDAFMALVEAAANQNLDERIWGAQGYHFTENGEHVWSELSGKLAEKAVQLGYISNSKEKKLNKDEAMKHAGFEAVSWGLNSRGKAKRLQKTIGWKPHRPSIFDEVENILNDEHERMAKSA